LTRYSCTLAALIFLAPFSYAQQEGRQQRNQDSVNAQHASEVDAAQTAALHWLTIVDAEKYEESWKEAAPFLKEHFAERDWEKHLDTIRKPIDPMVDRTLHTTQYREQFPGLPKGAYVAFVWESYFGTRHQVLESVIMSYDGSQWKPIGYAVQ
jgi:hypothetical protein